MKTQLYLVFLVLVLCGVTLPTFASPEEGNPRDILIIANKAVSGDSITPADVRNFFLKKQSRWPGGIKVVPVNAKDQALRSEFRNRVLDMSETEETRYWQDLKIKKGTTPPIAFGSVQKAVFKLKGAIGYIYRKDLKDGVSHILLVIPAS